MISMIISLLGLKEWKINKFQKVNKLTKILMILNSTEFWNQKTSVRADSYIKTDSKAKKAKEWTQKENKEGGKE